MSSKASIKQAIKKAITENNIAQLEKLKKAFDEVHDGKEEVKVGRLTITPMNLPEDAEYENICKILQRPLMIAPSIPNAKMSLLPDLWMGSLQKPSSLKICKDGIMIPKFDGVSAGAKFVRNADNEIVLQLAQTRGIKANITSKLTLLTTDLCKALNEYKPFKGIPDFMICIRGEIVLKDKTLTESAPAPYVSGKINGYEDVFKAAVDTMEFVPYEVMRLTKYGEKIRITQRECFDLLRELNQLKFEPKPFTEDVRGVFDAFCNELKEPLDGVVYCSLDWAYPITEAETMPAVYGKWAWKPSEEAESTLTGFEYSLSRDGKLEPMATYEEITIGGKKYSRAKIAIGRIISLSGIGIGSKITVRLSNGISPFIADFEPPSSGIVYEIPTECPACGSKLILTKGVNTTLKCTNTKSCPAIKLQKYKYFLKTLNVKGIADKKLQSLKRLNFSQIISKYISSKELLKCVMKSDVKTLFQAIGYGGKKTVEKMLKSNELEDISAEYVENCISDVSEVLEKISDGDEFIDDVNELINAH